jgi:hypothetical protein
MILLHVSYPGYDKKHRDYTSAAIFCLLTKLVKLGY